MNVPLRMSNKLLLRNVILTLCVCCAHGQGRICDFPEIKHGSIYNENKYKKIFPADVGKYFYYTCDHSFVTPSQSLWTRINCTERGWSPAPKCLRQCFFPWVENGQSTSSGQTHREGDIVHIVCDTGYSLPNGQSNITCGERGWSSPPECRRVYPQGRCGPPPPVDNGDTTSFPLPQYPPGSAVEYRCQAYYVLQGERHIVCRNGEWSEPPKCLDPCVISEEMMKQHNIQLKWRDDKKIYTRTDDTIEFMCKRGYSPRTPNHTFRTTCQKGKLVYPHCE